MLKLIYGKDSIYNAIKEPSDKGLTGQILIVPHHFSHEAERRLCEVCGNSVSLHCEVLTLRRLANRVFGEEGGLADAYLDDGGRILVMSLASKAVATKLKVLSRHINKPDFLADLVKLVNEFKQYNISPDKLGAAGDAKSGELHKKMSDLALLYSAYNAMLTTSLSDPADLLTRLAEKLEASEYLRGRTVYVSNFTEFTPQEMRIFETVLRRSENLTVELNMGASLDPTSFSEDIFLPQRITADRLMRMALDRGIDTAIEDIETGRRQSNELRFLEENLFASAPKTYGNEEKCKAIKLAGVESAWTECEQVASQIKSLCQDEGYMYRDILVASTRYSDYRGIIEAVFDDWGIPIFSDRMDPVMEKPIMTAIVSIIDSILGGFGYDEMFRYLKTGLCGLSYEDCCRLENYVIGWKIRGRMWTDGDEWTMNPFGLSSAFDGRAIKELEDINRMRRHIMEPILTFIHEVPASKKLPANVITEKLYRMLSEIGIEDAIREKAGIFDSKGDLKTADEYTQLWGLICDALDTTYTILGDTPMDFGEYAGYLKLLFSSLQVGTIPTSLDRVACGDAGRMRHRRAKCVFLLGAYSGAFPQPSVSGGILTDEDRNGLIEMGIEIDLPSQKTTYRELESAFAILTLPEDKLFISWPVSEGGADRSQSYLVSRIAGIFGLNAEPQPTSVRYTYAEKPCLELAISHLGGGKRDPIADGAYKYFKEEGTHTDIFEAAADAALSRRDNLSREAAERLYGKKKALTASRVDRFKTCKFAYFMQYGLNAKPRFQAELNSLEGGSYLHYVLEKSLQDMKTQEGFKEAAPNEIEKMTDSHSEEYAKMALGGLEDKSSRVRFLFSKLRRTAAVVLENITEELKASQFKPVELELLFGKDGRAPSIAKGEAEISGIVDRVDGWMHDGKLYLRVVDYKSGYKKFDLSDILHGLGMQMLVYLFALEETGSEMFGCETALAGVLYTPIREIFPNADRSSTADQIASMVDKELQRSGLLLDHGDMLDAMESGNPKRFIPVKVTKTGEYTARDSLAKAEQFGKLKKHIDSLLVEIGKEIGDGNIEADPFFRDTETTSCTYCEFAAACRFDETNGRDRLRYLKKYRGDEVWDRLEGDENDI